MPRERLIAAEEQTADRPAEPAAAIPSLRPQRLDEVIGQEGLIERLRIALQAARARSEPIEHVLLSGPPGLGKTTLAHVIANELSSRIQLTSGPALSKTRDLMSFLMSLQPADVLFIDEIHRLPIAVEEYLYPAMEDFRVDFTTEQGLGSRTVNFQLARFTLIGATTRRGLLTGPLRDRFGLQFEFDFYQQPALEQILERSARLLGCSVQPNCLGAIAARSRGTPRIANRLLRRVRDYAAVRKAPAISESIIDEALGIEEIDALGLDPLDRRFLTALIDIYSGGPAGIEAIAASMGQDRDTLEDAVEPYLLQIGFIRRTPKGRQATHPAYQHLGRPAPSQPPPTAPAAEEA